MLCSMWHICKIGHCLHFDTSLDPTIYRRDGKTKTLWIKGEARVNGGLENSRLEWIREGQCVPSLFSSQS